MQVLVEIENREHNEINNAVESINISNKKRKKDSPSPIALEPCDGNKAAVLSLLVRLPTGEFRVSIKRFLMIIPFFSFQLLTGGLSYSPPGQSAGLAVASALVTLGNRKSSLETCTINPKETKSKRKQSQHPDNL